MKKIFTAFLLACAAMAANATTYYVKDCTGSGAEATCVTNGNDALAGTSEANAWQHMSKVVTEWNAGTFHAGDQILFERGSSQTTGQFSPTGSFDGDPANMLHFGAYTPSGANAGGTNVPIINCVGSCLRFVDSGVAGLDEGVSIHDLHLIGDNTGNGVDLGNVVKHFTTYNMEIEHFSSGFVIAPDQSNAIGTTDGKSEFIILRDSHIHHVTAQGVSGSADHFLIENNLVEHCGDTALDHCMYITGASIDADGAGGATAVYRTIYDVTIRGNTIRYSGTYRTSDGLWTLGRCNTVNLVIHGTIVGLRLENNFIDSGGSTSTQCWGLSIDSAAYTTFGDRAEGFFGVEIRGNEVNNCALGIGLDNAQDAIIEANKVYSNFSSGDVFGIAMRSKNFVPGTAGSSTIGTNDYEPTNITIRNNSVHLVTPTAGSFGISMNGNIGDALTGTSFSLDSNVIYFGTGSTAATQCFNTENRTETKFVSRDYNICHYSATAGKWDSQYGSLASTQGHTGSLGIAFDTHSLTTAPTYAAAPAAGNNYSLAPHATSNTAGAGHPTRSSSFTVNGFIRPSGTPDAGAYQLSGSSADPAPLAPAQLNVN